MAGARVLLMEDDAALRNVIVEALSDEGIAVRVCATIDETLDYARRGEAEIALVDFWRSARESIGDEDARTLRTLGEILPVILTSGRSWVLQTTAAALGIAAVFNKPFDLDALILRVKQLSEGAP